MPFDGTQPEKVSLIARTLQRAAEIIETRGFCQHAYERLDGRVCCYRAMQLAARETAAGFFETHTAFEESLPAPGTCTWNNKPGRTKEQAVAQFRKAALVNA